MTMTTVIELKDGDPQGNEVWKFGNGFKPSHLGRQTLNLSCLDFREQKPQETSGLEEDTSTSLFSLDALSLMKIKGLSASLKI